MKIWKWTLEVTDMQSLLMPKGARLLDVQMQGGVPRLWALVGEHTQNEQRHFAMYGTGHPVPEEPGDYVASFQIDDGALVFHVFERGSRSPE